MPFSKRQHAPARIDQVSFWKAAGGTTLLGELSVYVQLGEGLFQFLAPSVGNLSILKGQLFESVKLFEMRQSSVGDFRIFKDQYSSCTISLR